MKETSKNFPFFPLENKGKHRKFPFTKGRESREKVDNFPRERKTYYINNISCVSLSRGHGVKGRWA